MKVRRIKVALALLVMITATGLGAQGSWPVALSDSFGRFYSSPDKRGALPPG